MGLSTFVMGSDPHMDLSTFLMGNGPHFTYELAVDFKGDPFAHINNLGMAMISPHCRILVILKYHGGFIFYFHVWC